MKNARNIAIVLVLAAVIAFVPGGGRAASTVGAILSILFAAGLAYFFGRTYLERRMDVYTLEDRNRAILYGAIGIAAVTFAAATRLLATGAGTFAFIALLGVCAYALFFVYRAWRQY